MSGEEITDVLKLIGNNKLRLFANSHIDRITKPPEWDAERFENVIVELAKYNAYIPVENAPRNINIAPLVAPVKELEFSTAEKGVETYRSLHTNLESGRLEPGMVIEGEVRNGRHVIYLDMKEELKEGDNVELSLVAHTHAKGGLFQEEGAGFSEIDFFTILKHGEILGGIVAHEDITRMVLKTSGTKMDYDENELEKKLSEIKKETVTNSDKPALEELDGFNRRVCKEFGLLMYKETEANQAVVERIFSDE